LSLRPDGLVTYTKHGRSFFCFIEVDRGTERNDAIRNKIERYHHFEKFGEWNPSKFEWFRILFITTEASRAKGLLKLFPSEAFWTATTAEVLARPLFDEYWMSKEEKSLPLDIGPNAQQLEQIEARKDAWLFASAPAPPPPAIDVRLTGQGLSPSPDPPVTRTEETPETRPQTRLWLKLAGGVAIGCVVVLLGFAMYHGVVYIQSHLSRSPEPQIFAPADSNANLSLKIVAAVGFLIIVRFIVEFNI
jgi:Replication-relaxation